MLAAAVASENHNSLDMFQGKHPAALLKPAVLTSSSGDSVLCRGWALGREAAAPPLEHSPWCSGTKAGPTQVQIRVPSLR